MDFPPHSLENLGKSGAQRFGQFRAKGERVLHLDREYSDPLRHRQTELSP